MDEPPLIVVEADEQLFRDALDEVSRQGWGLRPGWEEARRASAGYGRRHVFHGSIRGHEDAEAALIASLHGHGIVALVGATDTWASFVDDLGRVGPVVLRTVDQRADLLDDEQRSLLRSLADGRTAAQAGEALHLSVRSTQRRLRDARIALGAGSTAEAIHIARSRGLC
jgi:DNA-binding CsgD family transcriptional regulator